MFGLFRSSRDVFCFFLAGAAGLFQREPCLYYLVFLFTPAVFMRPIVAYFCFRFVFFFLWQALRAFSNEGLASLSVGDSLVAPAVFMRPIVPC